METGISDSRQEIHMGYNDTPSANRIHIGFFGKRNAGKSSLVNAVTGQSLSVVSDVAGTTTDPVNKSMELLPLGPVVITDTPGMDDEGDLGCLRVQKAKQALRKMDVAVLVVDGTAGLSENDRQLIHLFGEKNINYIIAYNKCDVVSADCVKRIEQADEEILRVCPHIWVSARERTRINDLKEMIGHLTVETPTARRLVGDLIEPGDVVVLVIPIDSAAPKGRLILPQQQVMRDVLDTGAIAVACRDTELTDTLSRFGDQVSLVVTDSQAFEKVMRIVPESTYLTSFSILMARFKGQLDGAVKAAYKLDEFGKDSHPKILIAEGCTHHRQCDDIGTVKLPGWINRYTGCTPEYHFTSGTEFPEDLSGFDLVIHCGGCMLNEREMASRQKMAQEQNIPMTNYGTAIAHMNGILARSLEVFRKSHDKDKNTLT